MSICQRIPQRLRILIVGVGVPFVIMLTLAGLYLQETRQRGIASCEAKARAVCLSAESIREHAEKQWADGVFDRKDLATWGREGQQQKVLSTVPIVLSMNSIATNAEHAGYKFRVPAFEARNPKNRPDEFESSILRKLQQSNAEELVEINHQTNSVHYFRPVRVGQSCLMCHGDSSQAESLWGATDGKDVTGFEMEGWKSGDIHGAFEIVQSLDEVDQASTAAIWKAAGMVVIGLTICGLLSLSVLSSIRLDTQTQSSAIADNVARQIGDNTATVAAAIEELSSNISSIAEGASEASRYATDVVSLVKSTTLRGTELGESTREINSILQMINSIADQTNLLALNATIEAARAGEAGRGFAVVAGEVKELSRGTSQATATITERIELIQRTSQKLQEDLVQMEQVIYRIDTAQSSIAGAVSQQRAASEEISRSLHCVMHSSRELSNRLRCGDSQTAL